MKAFVLHNDELGYTESCPVYEVRSEAGHDAASKCRHHTVCEVKAEDYEPCVPVRLADRCLRCARCAATEGRRRDYMREMNEMFPDKYHYNVW